MNAGRYMLLFCAYFSIIGKAESTIHGSLQWLIQLVFHRKPCETTTPPTVVSEPKPEPIFNFPHTRDEFDKIVNEAPPTQLVIVDFFATWCYPCKELSPKLEDLSKQYTGVVFMKVDVDELKDVKEKFVIRSYPTVLFLRDCRQLDISEGNSPELIEGKIIKHLNGGMIEEK